MSLNLTKNSTFNLSKDKPLSKVKAKISWKETINGNSSDLDIFAFASNSTLNHNLLSLLCYPGIVKNEEHPKGSYMNILNGAIVHDGDNLVGGEEFLTIDLTKIPEHLDSITIGVNIFDAIKTDKTGKVIGKQSFETIIDEVVSLIDLDNNKVLAHSDSKFISETIKSDSATPNDITLFEIGNFKRNGSNWDFVTNFKLYTLHLNDYLSAKSFTNE
jgi:stress response protein SCP2